MNWERVLACCFVIGGIAYASYSAIVYYQKIDVVDKITTPVVQAEDLKKLSVSKEKQSEEWLIVPKNERPKIGEFFGKLQIPKLDIEAPIIEGTYEEELANGVGHYTQSVLPGEPDNSVLSAHRDTIFRRLGELKKGDVLQVSTKQGVFVYQITKAWITDANDKSVIVPHERAILTLTTCYPFTFIGPAPERYVIQAELIKRL